MVALLDGEEVFQGDSLLADGGRVAVSDGAASRGFVDREGQQLAPPFAALAVANLDAVGGLPVEVFDVNGAIVRRVLHDSCTRLVIAQVSALVIVPMISNQLTGCVMTAVSKMSATSEKMIVAGSKTQIAARIIRAHGMIASIMGDDKSQAYVSESPSRIESS
jgi:hypothetical protein